MKSNSKRLKTIKNETSKGRKVKDMIKKILISLHIYPTFRRAYFLMFRLTGGQGGKAAQKYLNQLNASEFASLDELERIQNDKLKKLIKVVYENVPYYRKIMDLKGITPSDIKTKEDLKVFPVLTKQMIRANFDDLLNIKYRKKKLKIITTGGTTGTPMKFFFSKHEDAVRNAHWERWKKFAGVKQFDRFMYIGTDLEAGNNPNYEGTFSLTGYYLMASFGLDDNLMRKYWENIKKFKPVYLRGFAFACYILADFLRRNNINYPLKSVMTSGDMLYPHYREIIETVFSCKVFDLYHQNEDIVMATECKYHDGFHVSMESSIVEILDENDSPVSKGENGVIVGTHLENYSMPLIRYNICDMGSITEEKCQCGRSHIRIKQLLGRTDDWIITPDNKKVGHQLSVTMKPFYDEIIETQFVQEKKDTLIVKVVTSEKYTPVVEKQFEKRIRDQVGNAIKIQFQNVSEIPKTQRGKHRLIISEITEAEK